MSRKILFLTENFSWGGSELLWTGTAAIMAASDISIGICIPESFRLPQPIESLAEQGKVLVFRLKPSTLSFAEKALNRLLPYRLRRKPKSLKKAILDDFSPDLLVINQGFNFNGVNTMAMAMQNKIDYVTISHAVTEALWPDLCLRRKMIAGFSGSKANYFVSKDNLEVTRAQLGTEMPKAEVIYNPFNVSLEKVPQYPATDSYHLACVGRYEFYAKGQDVLLRTLQLEKWKSRNLTVHFYGEGRDVENLKDLIKLYKLENVELHGHVPAETIWENNHGLILTSRFEGLPLVVVEALLSERIAIVTDVSGSCEFISDKETGYIIPAPRPKYIDQTLEGAWQQRSNWKEMGQKARRELLAHIPENPAALFAGKLTAILKEL